MNTSRFSILPLLVLLMCALACNQPAPPPQESTPAAAPTSTPEPAATTPVGTPTESSTPEKQPATTPTTTPASTPAKTQTTAPETATPGPSAESSTKETTPAVPETTMVTLDAGTKMKVEFMDAVGSKTSQVGDAFRAKVAEDVFQNGEVVIPAGAVMSGTVTEAKRLAKIGGSARLGLNFNQLELPNGQTVPVSAAVQKVGKSESKKDAATIGGAAASGAVLGNVVSKKEKGKGTLVGAIVGAAAGAAIAAETKGQEIEWGVGTRRTITLDQATQVPVPRR